MNVQEGSRTVHIVCTTDREVEVFADADEAWRYARCKRGAIVLERMVRSSLGEAQIIYEPGGFVVRGRVMGMAVGIPTGARVQLVTAKDTIRKEPVFRLLDV